MQFSTGNVAVVGVGNVGIAGAYAMYLNNVSTRLTPHLQVGAKRERL